MANVRCAEIALAKELGNLEPPQQDTKKRRRKLPTLNEFLIEYVNNYGVKRWEIPSTASAFGSSDCM